MEAEDRRSFLMRADWLREEGARRAALLNAMDQDNDEDFEFNETFDFDAGDGFVRGRYECSLVCGRWCCIRASEYCIFLVSKLVRLVLS